MKRDLNPTEDKFSPLFHKERFSAGRLIENRRPAISEDKHPTSIASLKRWDATPLLSSRSSPSSGSRMFRNLENDALQTTSYYSTLELTLKWVLRGYGRRSRASSSLRTFAPLHGFGASLITLCLRLSHSTKEARRQPGLYAETSRIKVCCQEITFPVCYLFIC